jgi:hypothetical protein
LTFDLTGDANCARRIIALGDFVEEILSLAVSLSIQGLDAPTGNQKTRNVENALPWVPTCSIVEQIINRAKNIRQ